MLSDDTPPASSFGRTYLYMLPTLVILSAILPLLNRLIHALVLAGVCSVFLYAGTSLALQRLPASRIIAFGLDRLYTFFTCGFIFLAIYGAIAYLSLILAIGIARYVRIPTGPVWVFLILVLSYPALKRSWPALAIAFVVPNEMGRHRIALGFTGHYWRGPGMRKIIAWSRQTNTVKGLHGAPIVAVHVLLISVGLFTELPAASQWRPVAQIMLMYAVLPVAVYITYSRCVLFWCRVNPI